MKIIDIKDKLTEMGISLDSVKMGDFDYIGEFTAKRDRKPNDPNYNKFGAFYRSNYERGILIYYLIRKFNLTSMLEIGFGRGYATICAAKAFHDSGIKGKITTIDPAIDEKFLQALTTVFSKELFQYINFMKCTSKQGFPNLNDQTFDLIYIDGDHSYEGTKLDWEWSKSKFNSFLLFDDYHMSSKNDPGIDCARLIDEIDDQSKELILMDRRMFFDDRRIEKLDYGQVLLTNKNFKNNDNDW